MNHQLAGHKDIGLISHICFADLILGIFQISHWFCVVVQLLKVFHFFCNLTNRKFTCSHNLHRMGRRGGGWISDPIGHWTDLKMLLEHSLSCPHSGSVIKCSLGAEVVILHRVIINFLWNSNMKFSYLDVHSFGEGMCWMHLGAALGCSEFTNLSTRRFFSDERNDLPATGKNQIFHSNMLNIMSCIKCSQKKLKPLGLCWQWMVLFFFILRVEYDGGGYLLFDFMPSLRPKKSPSALAVVVWQCG